MQDSFQDDIIARSEKRVTFSIMPESDPDTDSPMSGSDYDYEDMRSPQDTQPEIIPEQLEQEVTIPSVEVQISRPILVPKSRKANATPPGEATPATDIEALGAEASRSTATRRTRSRSAAPKPERKPKRVSKRKRGLEPSNDGLPRDPAPTKRARKYSTPSKSQTPASRDTQAPNKQAIVESIPSASVTTPTAAAPEAAKSDISRRAPFATMVATSSNNNSSTASAPLAPATLSKTPAIKQEEPPEPFTYCNAVIHDSLSTALTALNLPVQIQLGARLHLARVESHIARHSMNLFDLLPYVGACIKIACDEMEVEIRRRVVADELKVPKSELKKAEVDVRKLLREREMRWETDGEMSESSAGSVYGG